MMDLAAANVVYRYMGETTPVPSTVDLLDSTGRQEGGARTHPRQAPLRRKSGSAPYDVNQMHAKRGGTGGIRAQRRRTLDEQKMDRRGRDNSTHQGQQIQTTPRHWQTDETYQTLCPPIEQEMEASDRFLCGGLAKGAPRTQTEPRPTDGHLKPLCTIPFNVSISDAKAGKFPQAREPVFVYFADARMKAGIRIRFSSMEGTALHDIKTKPFQDGKSITKGDLAMSIATKLENVFTTNKQESTGELFFVDLVQECWETFRPNFTWLLGGA